jgi:hypothetical protein
MIVLKGKLMLDMMEGVEEEEAIEVEEEAVVDNNPTEH